MKETITRSLTGLAFIALIISSLVFNPIPYLILFSLISALGWLEFSRLFPERITLFMNILMSLFLAGNSILFYLVAADYLSTEWLFFSLILLLSFLAIQRIFDTQRSTHSIKVIVAGTIYLLAGFSLMHFLAFPGGSKTGYSPFWILFTFFFLWTNDSMAYVSGRLFGQHHIWPAVSPGKTWEGSIGGAFFTLFLAVLLSLFYPELSLWEWIGFSAIVILFGSLGDFFESWLKRKAGVKDSGKLLPGHGGILDRFDSFIFSIPVLTIYINFVL